MLDKECPQFSHPPSPLLGTTYSRPRVLYLTAWFIWSSLAIGRYLFLALNLYQPYLGTCIVFFWSLLDGFVLVLQTLNTFVNNCLFQHRGRWLRKTGRQLDAKQISHVLTILHYKEPKEQLYDLVQAIAEQEAEGKKFLFIGMERGTPEQQEKINEIVSKHEHSFADIRYCIHDLRPGEISGTGSNHFNVQVAAEQYFSNEDPAIRNNVIFTKFDCNMRLAGPLLQEIESVWCTLDESKRTGISFMPNVFWSADVPDNERSFLEKYCAFAMSVSANMAPFSMAFVSGSLNGVIQAGYTPPGLLSEDELTFAKRMCMVPHAATYRLSSCIMKVFYPPREQSYRFGGNIYVPKLERWFVGWVEVHAYLLSWLCGRWGLPDHPRVRNPGKALGVLFLSVSRLYSSFCFPIQTIPSTFVNKAVWNLLQSDPEEYWWLKAFLALSFLNLVLNFAMYLQQIVRIQWRLYHRFDCLKWSHSTAVIQILGTPLIFLLPLRLLWTFFTHGIRNRPVVHTAQMDELKWNAQGVNCKPLKGATACPINSTENSVLKPLLSGEYLMGA
mmetsp:Transcript_80610/g.142732  ORF Transcript_80610/g.142732 Transcript_80610/m.142732 type:complete len:556 (-) Transcript_80610:150-1817(-)